MKPACKELERVLLSGLIRHDHNPVMTWMVSNVKDGSPAKESGKLKKGIDSETRGLGWQIRDAPPIAWTTD